MTSLKRVIIGYFGPTYGIKGWLKVRSLTQPMGNILNYSHWQTLHLDQWQDVEIAEAHQQGNHIVIKLAHCDTPETARTFTGNPISIFRNQMPPLPEGEYFWTDLIGLRVINKENIELGIIDHLFETGANDVMVLKGERKRLVPYTKDVIQSVDLTTRTIIVDWDADF